MSLFARAASFAAVAFCASFLLGTTTPSFAQELHGANVTTFNALTLPQVPMAPTTEARLVPAVLQTVQDGPRPTPTVAQDAIVQNAIAQDGDPDFASLSAAVAAQDDALSDREIRCLAAAVFYESKGEPLSGQLAVAQTIINRTRSGRFPKSICSVLTQAGQFSFVRGGVVPTAEGRNGWTTAVAIAKVAQADLWNGVAETALYFHARRVAPGWRMQKVAAIGNHVFYR